MSQKGRDKEQSMFNGLNIPDRVSIDEFVEKLVSRLSGSFEKEIKRQIARLTVEYKRDKQDTVNTGITARAEERAKEWICPRIPSWVNSDHLTVLGLVAAFIIVAGFILGFNNRIYLLLVVLGLFLNWFGDSFDGSLARYRKKTRPNYGYYIDHMIDAIVVMILAIGLGISGFARIDVALLFALVYLGLMIHVELVTYVQNTFKYSFGVVGPTEMRIVGVFITIYMYFAPIKYYFVQGYQISQYDIAILALSIAMFVVLIINILKKGIELDRMDRKRWKS
ncbi:MAG: CDP-alcohol phosphatidyltransferase family protein [Candidatus Dojkabacteria bacterium]